MGAKVAALLSAGSDGDRAIAVELAEAGCDIAIGTIERGELQEFATASIANEVWAIGREQMSSVVDATDAAALAAFAAEVSDQLGRCDLVAVRATASFEAPADEISADEWGHALLYGLTVPFLVAHAFAPVVERGGGGSIVFLPPETAAASIVAQVTAAARIELCAQLNEAFRGRGIEIIDAGQGVAPASVAKLLR